MKPLGLLLLIGSHISVANALVLDIDSLPGWGYNLSDPVPLENRLTTQRQAQGVLATSYGGFVTVLAELGISEVGWRRNDPTVRSGLAGSSPDGIVSAFLPVDFIFVNPLIPTEKWVVSNFSITGDYYGDGSSTTITAYDRDNDEVGSTALNEHVGSASVGTRFSIVANNMHYIRVWGSGTTKYGRVQYVPFPYVQGQLSIQGNSGPVNGTASLLIYKNGLLQETRTATVLSDGRFNCQFFTTDLVTIKVRHLSSLYTARPASASNGPIPLNFVLRNGDVDSSGEVDAADIDAVIAAFGATNPPPTNPDVDGSGEVDAADIDLVISNFGEVDE